MKRLTIPVLTLIALLAVFSSCKKKTEELTVTKQDTVNVYVDSSRFTRTVYSGTNEHKEYANNALADSVVDAVTLTVIRNYKDNTISIVGDPFGYVDALNSADKYDRLTIQGNYTLSVSYEFVGDYLHISYWKGYDAAKYVTTYFFIGKK